MDYGQACSGQPTRCTSQSGFDAENQAVKWTADHGSGHSQEREATSFVRTYPSSEVHYRSRAASDSLLPSYPQAKPPVQGVHSLLSPVIGPRSGQTSSMPPYHSCTVINPSTQVVAPAPATQLSYPPYHTYCPTAVHIAGSEERRVAVSSTSTGSVLPINVIPQACPHPSGAAAFVSPTGDVNKQGHIQSPADQSFMGMDSEAKPTAGAVQRPTHLPVREVCHSSSTVSDSVCSPFVHSITPTPQPMQTSMVSPFATQTPGDRVLEPTEAQLFSRTMPGLSSHNNAFTNNSTHTVSGTTSLPPGQAVQNSSPSGRNSLASPCDPRAFSPQQQDHRGPADMTSPTSGRAGRPALQRREANGPSRCLPKHAKTILREWLESNLEYPYPSDQEKQRLARNASITTLQVSYWFVNARRRILPKLLEEANNRRTASNLPPIQQVHPCARFFPESFRPVRDAAGAASQAGKLQDVSQTKATLPTLLQPGREYTLYPQTLQTYETTPPPLLLQQRGVLQQAQQSRQSQSASADGSDCSSDDSSSTWPAQAKPMLSSGNSAHQRRQSCTLPLSGHSMSMYPAVDQVFSPVQQRSSAPPSVTMTGAAPGNTMASDRTVKMEPSATVFSPQDQPSSNVGVSTGATQSVYLPMQYSQYIHPMPAVTTDNKLGVKEDRGPLNGISSPITSSGALPETIPANNQHFVFPTPAVMPSAAIAPAFYGNQDHKHTASMTSAQSMTTFY